MTASRARLSLGFLALRASDESILPLYENLIEK